MTEKEFPLALVEALCAEAGLELTDVSAINIRPDRITFDVLARGRDGDLLVDRSRDGDPVLICKEVTFPLVRERS